MHNNIMIVNFIIIFS